MKLSSKLSVPVVLLILALVILALVALSPGFVWSQTRSQSPATVTETPLNVKPGLWQIDMTLAYGGLPPNMQAMLDRMPAEQRAAAGFGGTKSFHRCVTTKQLNTPWVEGDANCTWTVLKSTANDLEVRGTSCRLGRNEGMNSEVDVNIHVLDSEHLRASMHGTANGNGTSGTLNGNYTGKWLGASCPSGMN